MIDTGPLEQQIQAPAARQLGLDDPDVNAILALAERNNLIGASERAQALWETKVYDVRTLGCYLAGVFMERGLVSLPLILDCVLKALTLNWPYLGPAERKQRLCDVSMRWLFTTLLTQMDFHHRTKTPQWEIWNKGWNQLTYRETVDRCVQLSMLLDDVIPSSRCRGPLMNFQTMLDGIVRPSSETAGWKAKMADAVMIPAPPPPPDPPGSSTSQAASSSDDDSSSGDDSSPDGDSSSGDESSPDGDGDSDASGDESSSSSRASKRSSGSEDEKKDEDGGSDGGDSKSSSSRASQSDKASDSDDEKDSDKDDDQDDADSESKSSRASSRSASAESTADPVERSKRSPISTASSIGIGIESAPSSRAQLRDSSDSFVRMSIPPPFPTGDTATLPISPALRVLMRQLEAFTQLAKKGQLKKAAILYRQIQQSIAHFDPRFYLPSLFGAFYAQLAKNGSRINAKLKEPEDFASEALTELCRVDLDLFLSTEVDE